MISNDAGKNVYFTAYVIIQNTIITDYNLDDNVHFPVMCHVFSSVNVRYTVGVLVSQPADLIWPSGVICCQRHNGASLLCCRAWKLTSAECPWALGYISIAWWTGGEPNKRAALCGLTVPSTGWKINKLHGRLYKLLNSCPAIYAEVFFL